MKVSIITVTYNSASTIKETLNSIYKQSYKNIEHIVFDGLSNDGTQEILKNDQRISKLVIQKDNGMYEAINNALNECSGDIICILNSDDIFSDEHIIANIVKGFKNNPEINIIISSVFIVSKNKIKRILSPRFFKPIFLKFGWMPPHPGIFLKKEVYADVGKFNDAYKIAADYDFMIRLFLKKNYSYIFLDKVTVKMKEGGLSTSGIKSSITITNEIHKSLKENGFLSSVIVLYLRLPLKYFINIFKITTHAK